MKTSLLPIAVAVVLVLFATGCASTRDQGPYLAETPATLAHENTSSFVLLDPGVQYSVTCSSITEQTLPDGRLEVTALIRNRENRRLEVQVNCVFKDDNMVPTGDETSFQPLILTENAQEAVKFTSVNALAKKYTVRVRQAR
jgi:hypothetical protein